MSDLGNALLHALGVIGSMTWQIAWSLILGFALSAVIESLAHKSTISRLLPDDHARSLVTAAGFGAASSSCSYAAVALARSLFRKGANFTAAVAFQIASTNLVIELGLILALLLGWQFTAAEFVGGPIMIAIVALLLRRFASPRLVDAARTQADEAIAGSMEGHAAMDMSITTGGSFLHRLASREGVTSVSQNFVMEWAAILRDLAIGLVIAGCAAAWIPDAVWGHLFFTGHPLLSKIWGPLVGPLVAIASFVCSIGNVPLAAVLWNGGISFGGVVSFIFADLLIVPILLIYRKYYGPRIMWILTGCLYAAAVIAGYLVELMFSVLRLIPSGPRHASTGDIGTSWNYKSWLNIFFLVLAFLLVGRFFATGGPSMLAMMGGTPEVAADGRDRPDASPH